MVLDVDAGGKIAFDFNGKAVAVASAESKELANPAIARFLGLIERDIAQGRNIMALPDGLARSLRLAWISTDGNSPKN